MPRVDCWTIEKDAMKFNMGYPVIAHPDCAPWGRYAKRYGILGKDGDKFKTALKWVRSNLGILEHPEGS